PNASWYFMTDTATPAPSTLSLHDALPISTRGGRQIRHAAHRPASARTAVGSMTTGVRSGPRAHSERVQVSATPGVAGGPAAIRIDRKSTRLNSSHDQISYAVFCLKKKKKK